MVIAATNFPRKIDDLLAPQRNSYYAKEKEIIMPNAINQRIVTLCKEKGYTWYRLSALSGIPVSTIVSIINRNNAPTIPTLQKLCDALGLTLSQFFAEGFETTTKTQDMYLYEFNRLDNHEQDLVLAYIQGMLDAKDIRMEKQAQQEAENIAKGKVRKKGGRKKKNPEMSPAGESLTDESMKAGEGRMAESNLTDTDQGNSISTEAAPDEA